MKKYKLTVGQSIDQSIGLDQFKPLDFLKCCRSKPTSIKPFFIFDWPPSIQSVFVGGLGFFIYHKSPQIYKSSFLNKGETFVPKLLG